MKVYSTALLSLLCQISTAASGEWKVGEAVKTTSGEVVGHAANLDASVSQYLGIPWGAAPVGTLRFMPPQPFPQSTKPIIADKFGPDCPQVGVGAPPKAAPNVNSSAPKLTGAQAGLLGNLGASGKYSEDCLTLNVWTKPQTGEKKKAVLVWIYGGGFTSGSTTNPSTNGVKFAAEQDVVLVSIK
jgi:carboxylesterase type B